MHTTFKLPETYSAITHLRKSPRHNFDLANWRIANNRIGGHQYVAVTMMLKSGEHFRWISLSFLDIYNQDSDESLKMYVYWKRTNSLQWWIQTRSLLINFLVVLVVLVFLLPLFFLVHSGSFLRPLSTSSLCRVWPNNPMRDVNCQ
jgi:hypothetical protein